MNRDLELAKMITLAAVVAADPDAYLCRIARRLYNRPASNSFHMTGELKAITTLETLSQGFWQEELKRRNA